MLVYLFYLINWLILYSATVVKKYSEIYMNVTVPFKWVAKEKDTSFEEMAPKNQTEFSQKFLNGSMMNDDANVRMNNTTPKSTIDNTTSISTINNTTVKMQSTTETTNFATTVKLIKEETLKLVIFI